MWPVEVPSSNPRSTSDRLTAEELGLPHEGYVPANRWLPPKRERRLPASDRRAMREAREIVAAGFTLEPGRDTDHRRALEGWVVAFQIAGELHISPWDALLVEVRRTAWRIAQYEEELSGAENAQEVAGDGRLAAVERLSFRERQHGAKVAQMAIAGGVAERLVAQVEADGAAIAGVLKRTVERLGLASGDVDRARAILREELLALDASSTIEGDWNERSEDEHVAG